MDESDDSERWEDFFGSSTELAPSVIGYYDSLTTNTNTIQTTTTTTNINKNNNNNQNNIIQENNSCKINNSNNIYQIEHKSLSSVHGITSTSTSSTSSIVTSTTTTNNRSHQNHQNKIRNFGILSSNVQRMISNTNDLLETNKNLPPLNVLSSPTTIKSTTGITSTNKITPTTTSAGLKSNFKRVVTNNNGSNNLTSSIRSRTNLPLSKITGKLTQSGAGNNELIIEKCSKDFSLNNCVMSSNESLDESIKTPTNRLPPPSPPSLQHLSKNYNLTTTNEITDCNKINDVDDNDKTPTNPNRSFIFERLNSIRKSEILLSDDNFDDDYDDQQQQNNLINLTIENNNKKNNKLNSNNKTIIKRLEYTSSTSSSDSNFNKSYLHSHQQQQQQKQEQLKQKSKGIIVVDEEINEDNKMLCVPSKSDLETEDDSDGDENYQDSVGEASNFYVRLPNEIRKSLSLSDADKQTTVIFNNDKLTSLNNNENIQKLNELIIISDIDKQQKVGIDNVNDDDDVVYDDDVTALRNLIKKSPRLSYSRKKLLTNKPLPVSPRTSRRTSNENKLLINENDVTGTEASTTTTSSSVDEIKTSSSNNNSLNKNHHRPLSASSLCSTSSSSSSCSEHLTGKHGGGVSYLASVESLADHSESELVNSSITTVSERAAQEILDSERSYVDDLGQVIRGYLKDWKERACLKINELKILFSNIEEIYEFNTILMKQLINSGAEPAKIAKCFIDLKDEFNVYTIYCTSYPEAISLLTSLLQASHTNSLLASTQKLLKHNLPLGSYLLKPVQRILKYHLLLDNLRKHCDSPEVAQAHELMRSVAKHIDQVKKNLEQLSRVKELSGILDGWLGPELTVLGDLRLEGSLLENNKRRNVFLFQTMLIITKPKEDNRLQFKTYIHCKNLMLVEHLPGDTASFHVIPFNDPRNQIKLTARNRDQKRLWAQQIKQVMLEHFDIPNRAKELVYKLGDEEDHTPDKNTWKWGHSSTPEYLERRNQYRRSEMRYRSKKARKNMSPSLSLDAGFSNKSIDDEHILPPSRTTSIENLLNNKVLSKYNNNHNNKCNHRDDNCNCRNVKTELNDTLTRKQQQQQSKELDMDIPRPKSRSKSEPRISDAFYKTKSFSRYVLDGRAGGGGVGGVSDDDEQIMNELKRSTLGGSRQTITKPVEVKMYNTKTLPKRIANLKKNRAKSMKETSKFYMELTDDTTILRITESTDNLCETGKNTKKQLMNDTTTSGDCGKDEVDEKNNINVDLDDDDGEKSKSLPLNGGGGIKNDSEIISELLKEHKGFDRIYKKPPPKKKSIDNGIKTSASFESINKQRRDSEDSMELIREPVTLPPPLPPPPPPHASTETVVDEKSKCILSRLNDIQNDINSPEPIYESLLRNVHVPYKYSPVMTRSISYQVNSSNNNSNNNIKIITEKLTRPDSDYVTLEFSSEGLKTVSGQQMTVTELSQLRNSDSNINYNKMSSSSPNNNSNEQNNTQNNNTPPKFQHSTENFVRHGSFNLKQSKNLLQRFISLKNDTTSSSIENFFQQRCSTKRNVDNLSLNIIKSSGKLPQRRVSDVSEMCRKITYKQGSENMGSKIAQPDYADPKTLFQNIGGSGNVNGGNGNGNCNNILINKNSIKPQRDSVFSLTSSSDSVCDTKSNQNHQNNHQETINSQTQSQFYKNNNNNNGNDGNANMENSDSFYEDKFDVCIENDGVFRDSAIYSDDNERKIDTYDNMGFIFNVTTSSSTSTTITSSTATLTPTTTAVVKNYGENIINSRPPPKIPRKPMKTPPPPLPTKPQLDMKKKLLINQNLIQTSLSSVTTLQSSSTISDKSENDFHLTSTTTAELTTEQSTESMMSNHRSWVLKQIKNFDK